MTGREMQYKFGIVARNTPLREILSDEMFYWINQAIQGTVKAIFGPDQSGKNQFEVHQKFTDDLQSIVKKSSRPITSVIANEKYSVTLPADYWFKVRETVIITFNSCKDQTDTYSTTVEEANMNNIDAKLWDPFSDHILRFGKANPLRIEYSGIMELYCDGTYSVTNYTLYYIAKPTIVSATTSCDLPEETHEDIVTMAVNLALNNYRMKHAERQPNTPSTNN